MKKVIVLYQSKYGATKKYAQWLADELPCDLMVTKDTSLATVQPYDVMILGGGIYAGGIAGFSFIKKHYDKLKGKKIIVFAVGASPYDEKAMDALRKRHFTGDMADIPCFYCRGAWDEDAMSWKDRAMCGMLKKMVAKKDPSAFEPWETALMEAMGSQHDWTDKENLKPIIEAVRAKQNS